MNFFPKNKPDHSFRKFLDPPMSCIHFPPFNPEMIETQNVINCFRVQRNFNTYNGRCTRKYFQSASYQLGKSFNSSCASVYAVKFGKIQQALTLAIIFALLQIELLYLACVSFVTRLCRWYHVVTLTVTFHLLQGQICCRAGDHNSMNLLVITTLSDDRVPTVKRLFHVSFLEKVIKPNSD